VTTIKIHEPRQESILASINITFFNTSHPYTYIKYMATSEPPPLMPSRDAARRSDTLRFHTSPPPSLTARFATGNPQSVSMTGEDDTRDTARTLPGELRDPQGTLNRVSPTPPEVYTKLTTSSLPIWSHRNMRIVIQISWPSDMSWKRC